MSGVENFDLATRQHGNGQVENGQCGNVVTEFFSSFYRTGIQRPVEAVAQLTDVKVEHVETEDKVNGGMKIANVAGNAAGELFDVAVLSHLAGKALSNKISLAPESALATNFAEGSLAHNLLISGATGFLKGSLLTPLAPSESQWRRLGQGITDAGTFMVLGGATHGIGTNLGEGLFGRAAKNAVSGSLAGLANVNLEAWTHGQLAASTQQNLNSMEGWAVGNMVFGESTHLLGKGLESSLKKVTDATGAGGKREPIELNLLSMREIAHSCDNSTLDSLMSAYHPELQKAFPLPGEIESSDTYKDYLKNHPTWEMEQLVGPTRGGIQYQVMDVDGVNIKRAGWREHLWVGESLRQQGYGRALSQHLLKQLDKKGCDLSFGEFNNPDKMTPEEIIEDAKGGILTQDRVAYWSRPEHGRYAAVVPSTGEIAPYAQPGMDGQEPVPYLSLSWAKLGGLDGQTILKSDYLKVLLAAHKTITEIETDPTVKDYTDALNALPDEEFQFVRLSDYVAGRSKAVRINETGGLQRLMRWAGLDNDAPQK